MCEEHKNDPDNMKLFNKSKHVLVCEEHKDDIGVCGA